MSQLPFSSERPIGSLAEDQLGRAPFAAALAKVIGQWHGRDSLVIGLYGAWGSGKTSLKNMAIDSLHRQGHTLILEFNPWEWAGQDRVFAAFFEDLSAKLGRADPGKKAAQAADVMRLYGAMLSAAAFITGRLRWLLVTFLLVLAFFGLAPRSNNSSLLIGIEVLSIGAVLLAAFLTFFGGAAEKLAVYFAAKSAVTRDSVADVKKQLQRLLMELGKNLLVVIDDVDRLTSGGIRTVFQLVKANADFPNLVYLVLMQREIIEAALSENGKFDGSQFLDKVVQVAFDTPRISADQLQKAVDAVINAIVAGTPAEKRFDSHRWGTLFYSAVVPYFLTLRDVKRFANSASFHFELYLEKDEFDANPIDLLALEVLRQFEGTVYQKLHSAKPLLTGSDPYDFRAPAEKQQIFDALLEGAKRPDCLRRILEDVFPPITRALAEGGSAQPSSTHEWRTGLRACVPELFERYFRFRLGEDEVTQADLQTLLLSMNDRAEFTTRLIGLDQRGVLPAAIRSMHSHAASTGFEANISLVAGLFDIEQVLFQYQGPRDIALERRALWIVELALRGTSVENRAKILRAALQETRSLYLPMICFQSTDSERQAGDLLVSDADAADLQAICVKKIEATRDDELLAHPRLQYILNLWSKWGPVGGTPAWVRRISQTDEGLLAILPAFTQAMNEVVQDNQIVVTRYRFALEELARYIEAEQLYERIRKLASTSNEQQRIACKLFLHAFDRRMETGTMSPLKLDLWSTLEELG